MAIGLRWKYGKYKGRSDVLERRRRKRYEVPEVRDGSSQLQT